MSAREKPEITLTASGTHRCFHRPEIIMSIFKHSRLSEAEARQVPIMMDAVQQIYRLSTDEMVQLLEYSSPSSVTEVKRGNRRPSRGRYMILCAVYMGGFLGLQALTMNRNLPSSNGPAWPTSLLNKIRERDQDLFMERRSVNSLIQKIADLEDEIIRLSPETGARFVTVASAQAEAVFIPARPNELGGDDTADLDF